METDNRARLRAGLRQARAVSSLGDAMEDW